MPYLVPTQASYRRANSWPSLVSDRYDQLSLLRTIELIFGLDPHNHGDGLATPMFGIFSATADPRPYAPPVPPLLRWAGRADHRSRSIKTLKIISGNRAKWN